MVNLTTEFDANEKYVVLRKLHTGDILEGSVVFIFKCLENMVQVTWNKSYNPSSDWYADGYVENIWLNKIDPQRLAFIKVGENFERDKLAAIMRFN